jgi:conserved hypothetical protein
VLLLWKEGGKMKFLTLVSLILIIAKIFGLISLSWLMCFLPFLVVIAIEVIITLLAIILLIVGCCCDK